MNPFGTNLLRSRVFGNFDGSGVSGYTGRGRSQALESKVRFADYTEVTLLLDRVAG
jgi:hypothetical protein